MSSPDDLRAAGLDDPRLRALLADPAMWDDPGPECRARSVLLAVAPVTDLAQRSRRRTPARSLLAAVAAVAAAVALVVVLARPSSDGGRSTSVDLAGPSLTVPARVAEHRSGWSISLDASGLPPAGAGRVYEAWLDVPGGRISAGTFRAGGEVRLWTGLVRVGGAVVSVSRESVPGPAGRDGSVVASGVLPKPA